MKQRARYPRAVDPKRVGKYPASTFAGGGYVWDEVLEYRVWCHPPDGESDFFYAFATHPTALAFSRRTKGAESPLALIRQREYIDEPTPGAYKHIRKVRITEWPVEFLRRPRRNRTTIPRFLSAHASPNRVDLIRGPTRSKPRRNRRKADHGG